MWAEIPPHLSWDVSLWAMLQDDPLVLSRPVDGQVREVGSVVGSRSTGALTVAGALFGWVELGLSLPVVFYQSRNRLVAGVTQGLPALSNFGVSDLVIHPKFRILKQDVQGIGLSVMPRLTVPISSKDSYFGDRGVRFAPEVLVSRSVGAWRLAANLGLRFRKQAQFVDLKVENEIYGRLGVGYRFDDAFGIPLETDVSVAVATSDAFFANTNQDYTEVLGGVNCDLGGPFRAFFGGGLGLNQGYGTPDFRIFGGIRFSRHNVDGDGDGILDREDACPEEAEDLDGFFDDDGCIDVDNDQDGVDDRFDGAPHEPEDRDGFEDDDGIPDRDNDKDGVPDAGDSCPMMAGPRDNLGCPDIDRDGDGIVDRIDRCRDAREDRDGFKDDDGCPEIDNDEDGVIDSQDQCPLEAGLPQNGGCPDVDRDQDGVADRVDNCPGEKGRSEYQGCKSPQKVVIGRGQLHIMDRVFFKPGSRDIEEKSYALLDNVVAVLVAHPEIKKIVIEGHTDSRGSAVQNHRLSRERADAVRNYLIERGVSPARVTAEGYGEERPVAPNETEEGREKNRRVDFRIVTDAP